MYPYQKETSEFLASRDIVGNFTFYGGGKTYETYRWFYDLWRRKGDSIWPALVCVPKSLITQWGDEAVKHTQGLLVCPIGGDRKDKLQLLKRPADVYIIGHDAITIRYSKSGGGEIYNPVAEQIKKMNFGTFVIDESTAFKNQHTKRFVAWYKLLHDCTNRMILSGLPLLEHATELWAQLKMLDWGKSLGTSYHQFLSQNFSPGEKMNSWVLDEDAGPRMAKQLEDRVIHVPKSKVLNQLPPKVYETVHFEMSEVQANYYNKLRREFVIELDTKGTQWSTCWECAKLVKLHQLASGIFYRGADEDFEQEGGGLSLGESNKPLYELFDLQKILWLQEQVPLMVGSGEKVLIWTMFKRFIPMLQHVLGKGEMPLRVGCYSGDQTIAERAASVRSFQAGKFDVFLLSTPSAFRGLNLQLASRAIFMNNGRPREFRENAEDRCHRLGSEQHNQITIMDLVTKGTVDEIILDALKTKQDRTQELLKHLRSVN